MRWRLRRRPKAPLEDALESAPEQLQIDRKILEDPSSFLDVQVQDDAMPVGLTPSTRPRPTESTSLDISPRTRSRLRISQEWSTFGRQRDRRVTRTSPLDDPNPHNSKHLSADSSLSTPSRLTNLSRTSIGTHDRPPSLSTPQDIQRSSPSSSPTHPQTPQRSTTAMNITTAVNRESPHTFGHPTPPYNTVHFSPPPIPLDHAVFRDRSNTLPTHQLFPSLSLRLGRATMSRDVRHRARTVSGERRTSADWSSRQATVGFNSWPAEVSREILRLSFPGIAGSSEKRDASTRAINEDPDRTSPSFLLPFPPPPSQPPPARLTDAREIPRPRSLQFDLGHRRDSAQRTRFTMDDVKRSLSATDHASGVTHPSLGLRDPASTSSDAALVRTPSRSLFSGRVFPSNTPMQEEPSTPTPEPRHLSDKSRGKRKAEDNLDLTPPEQKKEVQRATFLLPSESRSQRVSNSSHAPSSYHRKRARLSSTSPFATPVQSRPTSVVEAPSANRNHHFSSLSSGTGARIASRTPSRATSTRSRQPHTPSTTRKHERHQSMSQASIPISAYISPHAPSISRSTKFHMRDPRKPPKKPDHTPWGLRFATEDEPGSPIQAWCFFFGFILFPVWWIAGLFLRIPATRIAGDVDAEKGVAIDDPQIEHDAKIWRFRCRTMALVSLFTYVPFIVLVAIFAPR